MLAFAERSLKLPLGRYRPDQEGGKTAEEVIAQGADREIVEKIARLKRGASFKAAQIPPIFNISEKPLGLKDKWLL